MVPAPRKVVYRIQTERLVLRCWTPQDAPRLVDAITSSLDHLRPWLPWIKEEPESVAQKVEKIRQWRARFDRSEDFFFAICNSDESEIVGGLGFHNRIGAGAREIGYWIRADRAGRGLMTEAAAALTRVGFEIDRLHRIEIHCDPANIASAAIPRKLGFRHELTIQNRVTSPAMGPRDASIWVMLRDEFQNSRAASAKMQAFDGLGVLITSN